MTGAGEPLEPRRSRLVRWVAAAVLAVTLHVGCTALALMHWQEDDTAEDAAGPVAIEMAVMPVAAPLDMPDVAHGPQMEEAMLTPQPAKEVKEEVEKETPRVEESPLAPEPEVVLPTPRPVDEKKLDEEEPVEAIPEQLTASQTSPAPLTTAPPRIEAKEAVVAAAPAPGVSTTPARSSASWEKALISHLNRFKRYPDEARARSAQGVVSVAFSIDRDGQVIAARVIKSSGSGSLDAEALAVLRRANPLPAPPNQMAGPTFDLVLPIQFRIR